MKIAFVSTILDYPWGGADALWTAAAELGSARGHKLFLGLASSTAAHPRLQSLISQGASFHPRGHRDERFTRRQKARRFLERLRGQRTLVKALQHFAPDCVCLCQGGTYDALVEGELAGWLTRTKTPYVLVCQANAEASILAPASAAMVRPFLQRARSLVFVSRHNLRLAEAQLGVSLSQATLVQNPTPRADVPELPWPASPPFALATVGRLENRDKGLDLLVPALAEAFRGESNWQLNLFGRGPDESTIAAQIRAHGLEARINLRGYASDITTIWRDHHLMLLPSRLEGCSLAMMEAMLCGRPVLATPVGGVDEWIVDDDNGFVATSITHSGLVAALRRAWSARVNWAAMGHRAHSAARQLIDPAPGEKLLALLENPRGSAA